MKADYVLSESDITRTIKRMAHEIIEGTPDTSTLRSSRNSYARSGSCHSPGCPNFRDCRCARPRRSPGRHDVPG